MDLLIHGFIDSLIKVEGKGRASLEEVFKDKKPHLLRLVLRADNTFEISVDQVCKKLLFFFSYQDLLEQR